MQQLTIGSAPADSFLSVTTCKFISNDRISLEMYDIAQQ